MRKHFATDGQFEDYLDRRETERAENLRKGAPLLIARAGQAVKRLRELGDTEVSEALGQAVRIVVLGNGGR